MAIKEEKHNLAVEWKIYRWHVTRKLNYPSLNTDVIDKVDVTITPAMDDSYFYMMDIPLNSEHDLPDEKIGFWNHREELQLEGWTTERALMEALSNQNLIKAASKNLDSLEGRQIVEDMVFLQFVRNPEEFYRIWNELSKEQDLPDVTDLVITKEAYWVDYTIKARKLAKEMYNKVLTVMRKQEYAEK